MRPRFSAAAGVGPSRRPWPIGLAVLACLGSADALTAADLPPRPNIILVMTDDQGMGDLSCMGNTVLRTPHLDRLHGLSTRLTNFQVSPTCSPTRSSLLGGRHEFRSGVTHTILERERMALSTTTIAQVLQSAGYATGIFGKWHLGDEEPYQPGSRGFDEVFIHGCGGIGQIYPHSGSDFPPNAEHPYFDPVLRHNDRVVQTRGFCTDVFFQAALGWIKQQEDAGTPYFAYITPNAPHAPMICPESYRKRFLDMGWDEATAGRYGMIENIDDNIGLLMARLDAWDAWDNTLVIFMTDNGMSNLRGMLDGKPTPLFNAGFRTGKGTPYEGGTHVPAFWRWRGVLGEGVDVDALAAHIDIFPTFCQLAGVDVPPGIQPLDGRSLVPLLKDPQAAQPDRTLFVHQGRWEKGTDPNLAKYKNCAVRTSRWRFVNNKELYDVTVDRGEATDVAAEHPGVVAALRTAYDAWWEATVPLMVNEDVPLSPVSPMARRYEEQLASGPLPEWTPAKL